MDGLFMISVTLLDGSVDDAAACRVVPRRADKKKKRTTGSGSSLIEEEEGSTFIRAIIDCLETAIVSKCRGVRAVFNVPWVRYCRCPGPRP